MSGGFFAVGNFGAGGWLYLLTGILDILDGRIARATGKVSASGAYFDSVMDRYAEIIVFAGFAYFYRDSWVLFLVLAASLGSIMVSYTRARGESLGAGEILLTSMDTDGVQDGFDCRLTQSISRATHIPIIASGGAGKPEHFVRVLTEGCADAALAASIFHYGTYTVNQLKEELDNHGIPVRVTA